MLEHNLAVSRVANVIYHQHAQLDAIERKIRHARGPADLVAAAELCATLMDRIAQVGCSLEELAAGEPDELAETRDERNRVLLEVDSWLAAKGGDP